MKENSLIPIKDLFGNSRWFKPNPVCSKPVPERNQLLQELSDATGYPLGVIMRRTAGMQTPKDLRFILSAMKNVPKAKDARHAFNTVMWKPKDS